MRNKIETLAVENFKRRLPRDTVERKMLRKSTRTMTQSHPPKVPSADVEERSENDRQAAA